MPTPVKQSIDHFQSPNCLGKAEVVSSILTGSVWPRNELVRVDLEDRWVFGPGLADNLIWCSPAQSLQVLGEIICGDEGQDMGLEAFEIVIVISFDGGVLDVRSTRSA